MTNINKVFNKYFDLCQTILFQLCEHFCFPLYNSTGEARPHLPPLTVRPCVSVARSSQTAQYCMWMLAAVPLLLLQLMTFFGSFGCSVRFMISRLFLY